jgi:hypothetical protein
VDKDLSGRIKTLEEKLKGTAVEKKPKDLRRAIGTVRYSMVRYGMVIMCCCCLTGYIALM